MKKTQVKRREEEGRETLRRVKEGGPCRTLRSEGDFRAFIKEGREAGLERRELSFVRLQGSGKGKAETRGVPQATSKGRGRDVEGSGGPVLPR